MQYNSGESLIERTAATIAARQASYAEPSVNHQVTAELWNTYLHARFQAETKPADALVSAEDVAILNILQKIARLTNGTHDDSLLDIVGWAENIPALLPHQRNTTPCQSTSK